MLVDLDVQGVGRGAGIVRPDIALREADPVEHRGRQSGAVKRQLFGIRVRPEDGDHRAGMATDVGRRADVTRRPGHAHLDALADRERHDELSERASRVATSAMRRPSSSLLTTPRSIISRVMAAIQRS